MEKSQPYNLNGTEDIVTAFIPTGFFGELFYSIDGGANWISEGKHTPTQFATGIRFDPGELEFRIQITFFNFNCSAIYAEEYLVDWALGAKIVIDPAFAAWFWMELAWIGNAYVCSLRSSNINTFDHATLEPAIEGGVCASGAYDMSDDSVYMYIEKTDSDIFLLLQFQFLITDDVNSKGYILKAFDREHLSLWEIQG